mmetsp:Transcript_18152/g.30276  ORF Transcript_18152/g.30276 Transcript_18152/m.30276 type:complete len:701 (+) Transcript_18152:29-2131(+)
MIWTRHEVSIVITTPEARGRTALHFITVYDLFICFLDQRRRIVKTRHSDHNLGKSSAKKSMSKKKTNTKKKPSEPSPSGSEDDDSEPVEVPAPRETQKRRTSVDPKPTKPRRANVGDLKITADDEDDKGTSHRRNSAANGSERRPSSDEVLDVRLKKNEKSRRGSAASKGSDDSPPLESEDGNKTLRPDTNGTKHLKLPQASPRHSSDDDEVTASLNSRRNRDRTPTRSSRDDGDGGKTTGGSNGKRAQGRSVRNDSESEQRPVSKPPSPSYTSFDTTSNFLKETLSTGAALAKDGIVNPDRLPKGMMMEMAYALIDIDPDNLVDPAELERSFARSVCPDLSNREFGSLWDWITTTYVNNEHGAYALLRALPGIFFKDLKDVTLTPMCIGFGDLHADSFAVVHFADGAHLVYDNFQHVGPCPVGVDALRFFVMMMLAGVENKKTVRLIIEKYCKVALGGKQRKMLKAEIMDRLHCDPEILNHLNIGVNKEFHEENSKALSSTPAAVKRAIRTIFESSSYLKQCVKVLGVCEVMGIPPGRPKFWVHVIRQEAATNYAFKEDVLSVEPLVEVRSVDSGSWASGGKRGGGPVDVEWCKEIFWRGRLPFWDFAVNLQGKRYLVKSKMRGDVGPAVLKDLALKDRVAVYKAQCGLAAEHHRHYWEAMRPRPSQKELARWLFANSEMLAARYESAFRLLMESNSRE